MVRTFFLNQSDLRKIKYEKLLSIIASLSKLFSDNDKKPFLHYCLMENIFCHSFKANNLSLSDISIYASIGKQGIGLKTFLNKKNNMEKIAEFNQHRVSIYSLSPTDFSKKISIARNKRLEATSNMTNTDLKTYIYYCIAREQDKMIIHETPMALIDINKIQIRKYSNSAIHFSDNKNRYAFNFSKSTLFQEFNIKRIHEIPTEIIEEPLNF